MGEVTEALVLVAHGSHRNSASSIPACAHADSIRACGAFDEVREAFWKEEPAVGEVLRTLRSDRVIVVPLFMSDGYFTDRVIPRELRITAERELDVAKDVVYTQPVGTHSAMVDVILHRAETVTGRPEVGPGVALVLVGHGTTRHARSAASTRAHAARIRARDRFEEVHALFMDEDPRISAFATHVETTDIVCVPLFVANGYHTSEDLPVDLGLTDDPSQGYPCPADIGDHRLWYTDAIGTDPRMVDVILERARDAGAIANVPTDVLHMDASSTRDDGSFAR